jgi:hypothetical protein
MNFIVDSAKAMKKWAPILDALRVQDEEKRAWMSEYAEMHQMNENVGYATLNQNGMGKVLAPVISTIPGATWQGDGVIGSGDVAQNLLPVAMKIAAQTIGLDLVAVKPTASPRINSYLLTSSMTMLMQMAFVKQQIQDKDHLFSK